MSAIPLPAPRPDTAVPSGPPRSLYWLKTADPDALIPEFGAGTDTRAVVPDDERCRPLRDRLAARGVEVRAIKYWLERELVAQGAVASADFVAADADPGTGTGTGALTVRTGVAYTADDRPVPRDGLPAAVARDAFDALWQAHAPGDRSVRPAVAVEDAAPASWAPLLPHPFFNPAQAQAAPEVLEGDDHLLVVAPTGAGKTTIGMLAALRAILGQGRKAAWLVPQRSLTDELDRDLEAWRQRGLRVERLSGEYSVDAQRVREADLWVTTTEKFEVLCRTSSLRDALAEVGCLIVDEVHLLGDPERGPVLEAVLSRLRDEQSRVRVVGLSATVSNAEEVADWLGARLVRIAWRPSRLVWQLPTVPAYADWTAAQAARTRMTNSIVGSVTADRGSVLVFCGSKYSVRSTALAVAASRGIATAGIRPDDLERLREVCDAAGIGLHYKDWLHKKEAELAFRERRTDVLVATSTVAAGVNLPARAVVVRDTTIGRRDVDVATVQQMFGRAGRLGAGESTGWAFMIVDEAERTTWQQRLTGGYAVESQIDSSLADHVLAEVVQGRVGTMEQAEQWWSRTFAHHQGRHGLESVRRAVNFLVGADYCRSGEGEDGRAVIAPTGLGTLTTRMMVPTSTGFQLRSALARTAVPSRPDDAEEALIGVVAALVPKMAGAPLSEALKPAVAALLQARGRPARLSPLAGVDSAAAPSADGFHVDHAPGDLARAALLAAANSPRSFVRSGADIAGIPYATLRPVLEYAPRYLHWLGSQGFLGTVHPWVAIVAADLGKRVRWRRCGPPRGGGRLLWMCEQMATALHADEHVPAMWSAAREHRVASPDWATRTPPGRNRLNPVSYANLLRDRVAQEEMVIADGEVVVRSPARRVLSTWEGPVHQARPVQRGESRCPLPAGPGRDGPSGRGAALFSWRGDYRATGWLAAYSRVDAWTASTDPAGAPPRGEPRTAGLQPDPHR